MSPYGLPMEVQSIIETGENPSNIRVSGKTFPTYLYTQKYDDQGIVICKQQYSYNHLYLKTGVFEVCPDDLNEADLYSETKYSYNKYGQLTQTNNVFNHYNENGQLLKKEYQNGKSGNVVRTITYVYKNGKIISSKIHTNAEISTRNYVYNFKGLLTEVIKNKRSKIAFEYNSDGKVTQVSEVNTWRNKTYKNVRVTYDYDDDNRIQKIQTHQNSFLDKTYVFKYDTKGNLIEKKLNGELITSYQYNNDGMLIAILNNKKWGEDKVAVKYE